MMRSYTMQLPGSSTIDEYSKKSLSSDAEMENSTLSNAIKNESYSIFELETGRIGNQAEWQV